MGKPCSKCPWVSGNPQDKIMTEDPFFREPMLRGEPFTCHLHMGTCYGAELVSAAHAKKTEKRRKELQKQ